MKDILWASVLYFLGTSFILLGIVSLATNIGVGLGFFAAAALLLPVFRNLIYSKTNITLSSTVRALLVIVFAIGPLLYQGVRESAVREAKKASEEQAARQFARQQFQRERNTVLGDGQRLLSEGKYPEAIALAARYAVVADPEVNALAAEARRRQAMQEAETARVQEAQRVVSEKRQLLRELTTTNRADSKSLSAIYRGLAALEPDNANYIAMRDRYNAQVADEARAQEEQQRKQSLGLVWQYSTRKDDMSGGTIHEASVRSLNTVRFDFPYQGEQRATLTVRDHPRWGGAIIVEIERGQFVCNIRNDCSVNVRFDNTVTQSFLVNEPESMDSTVRFIRDAGAFLGALKRAQKVWIEANFYNEGNRVFEFDTGALKR